MDGINLWAVVVAAVSSFFLGGFWYSPALFGTSWTRLAGKRPAEQQPHPARVFGVSLVLAFVAAASFAYWLGPQPPLLTALLKGGAVGICFVAASFGINYQFSNRPLLLWLIDGGYHSAQFVVFGLVLGLWH